MTRIDNRNMPEASEPRRLTNGLNATAEGNGNEQSIFSGNDDRGTKSQQENLLSDVQKGNGIFRPNKKAFKIGTWNVRTMKEVGKLHLLIDELERMKLKITGLSEVRWTQSGHFTTKDSYQVFYSGSKNEKKTQEWLSFYTLA